MSIIPLAILWWMVYDRGGSHSGYESAKIRDEQGSFNHSNENREKLVCQQ